MAVRIIFQNGKAQLQGDGAENLPIDEHELLRLLAREIGGKVVEEKPVEKTIARPLVAVASG